MSRPAPKRCAIYTRKSSEEGLDQSFNSLDAQREACAAYIASQAGEGWSVLPALYDDGGYSGGSMERPALKTLLADISAGRVDIVVVYKIDRLTRSLADFARIVELFDQNGVTFVSVTQAFNTTSSMGRLTLNVLLSFAQFEREVTGERIRDKIAASKARGMWMGGTLPLGYDLPLPGTRTLVVNETEAETVRHIFRTYLELGSVHALMRRLDARGIRSKERITASGKTLGGKILSRGALFHLLKNRIYLGQITHRGAVHPGQHPAIVEADLFEAVQDHLAARVRRRCPGTQGSGAGALTGRIFDGTGAPMSPTTSRGARGRAYRYYVSAPLQQGRRWASDPPDGVLRRVAAAPFEARLAEILVRLTDAAPEAPFAALQRIEVRRDHVRLSLPVGLLPILGPRLRDAEVAERDPNDASRINVTLPIRIVVRSGKTAIEGGAISKAQPDPVLIAALRDAWSLVSRDAHGLPILEAAPASSYQRRLVRLAFLAPDLQRAILDGRQPPGLSLAKLLEVDIPLDWREQAKVLDAAALA